MGEEKLVQDVQEILTLQDQIDALEKQMLEIKNQYGLYKKCDIQNPYNLQQMINGMTSNKQEAEKAFLTILRTNVSVAKNFLNNYYSKKDPTHKDACFECMMKHPDEIVDLVQRRTSFSAEQVKLMWETHGEFIYKKVYRGYSGLIRFCEYFRPYINDDHRDVLVKRIIGRKLDWEAKKTIEEYKKLNSLGFKEEHIQQLEGYLVASRLMK